MLTDGRRGTDWKPHTVVTSCVYVVVNPQCVRQSWWTTHLLHASSARRHLDHSLPGSHPAVVCHYQMVPYRATWRARAIFLIGDRQSNYVSLYLACKRIQQKSRLTSKNATKIMTSVTARPDSFQILYKWNSWCATTDSGVTVSFKLLGPISVIFLKLFWGDIGRRHLLEMRLMIASVEGKSYDPSQDMRNTERMVEKCTLANVSAAWTAGSFAVELWARSLRLFPLPSFDPAMV